MKKDKSDVFDAEEEATLYISSKCSPPVGTSMIYTKYEEARCSRSIPAPNSANSCYFPNAPNRTVLTLFEYQTFYVHFSSNAYYSV